MLKHLIVFLFAVQIIAATPLQTYSGISQQSHKAVCIKSYSDDITYELKYLYDKNGKKFAAEICLKNNTGKTFRVTWTLKGSLNTNVPSESGTKDILPFTKVCIMTVFPVDPEKPWDPGVFHFDWEVVE
ncbi:MAG: hypothetical protein LWX07_01995 [Bacteroidetes bacterium]|nr:hypothetical protein [Bacteroidota bacterium]